MTVKHLYQFKLEVNKYAFQALAEVGAEECTLSLQYSNESARKAAGNLSASGAQEISALLRHVVDESKLASPYQHAQALVRGEAAVDAFTVVVAPYYGLHQLTVMAEGKSHAIDSVTVEQLEELVIFFHDLGDALSAAGDHHPNADPDTQPGHRSRVSPLGAS